MPAAPAGPAAARPWRIALIVLVATMLCWDGYKVWMRPSAETWSDAGFHVAMLAIVGAGWAAERHPERSAPRRRWTTVAVLGVLTMLTILGWRLVD
jgi:hypothetical protein